jgi:hypothetical protein
MIFTLEDLLDDLEEEFPDLTRKSIKRICETGLFRMKRILRSGRELILGGKRMPLIKFFIPMTPEAQHEVTKYNKFKDDIRRNEREK